MESNQYRNPPIVEAVCEFRFAEIDWDVTLPGRFYLAINDSYPEKPQSLQEQSMTLEKGELALRSISKIRFFGSDSNRQISLAPATLSIHDLKPYSGWTQFKQRIFDAYNKFRQITDTGYLQRVGIRYINHIHIAQNGSIDLEGYFTNLQKNPPGLPINVKAFFQRIEYLYPQEEISARVITTDSAINSEYQDNPTYATIALDIDVFMELQKSPQTNERIFELVEDLRNKERLIFEALITNTTRELFK